MTLLGGPSNKSQNCERDAELIFPNWWLSMLLGPTKVTSATRRDQLRTMENPSHDTVLPSYPGKQSVCCSLHSIGWFSRTMPIDKITDTLKWVSRWRVNVRDICKFHCLAGNLFETMKIQTYHFFAGSSHRLQFFSRKGQRGLTLIYLMGAILFCGRFRSLPGVKPWRCVPRFQLHTESTGTTAGWRAAPISWDSRGVKGEDVKWWVEVAQ